MSGLFLLKIIAYLLLHGWVPYIPQLFVECFHILSSFSTLSTFDTKKKHKRLIINAYYFLAFFGTQIVTMNSGFENESTKKVSK